MEEMGIAKENQQSQQPGAPEYECLLLSVERQAPFSLTDQCQRTEQRYWQQPARLASYGLFKEAQYARSAELPFPGIHNVIISGQTERAIIAEGEIQFRIGAGRIDMRALLSWCQIDDGGPAE